MLLAGVAAVFGARRRREYPALWWMMVALAAASAIMMFPVSLWFWHHLPKLQFLQFPWRWLVPLGIPYAFFLASAITQARWRWIWYSALALIIAVTATAIVRDAWWDSEDIPFLEAAIRTGHGYEGTDEYAPLGCDIYDLPGAILNPESPEVFEKTPPTPLLQQLASDSGRVATLPPSQISIDKWLSEHKSFRVETSEPADARTAAAELPGVGSASRRCDRQSRLRTGDCSHARAGSHRASSGRSEPSPDLGPHCWRRDFRLFGDYALCLRRRLLAAVADRQQT